jgi:hypothetical protein
VRDSYLSDQNRPASTTVAISGLAREGALLEVEAIAVLPAAEQTSPAGRKLRVQGAATEHRKEPLVDGNSWINPAALMRAAVS